MSTTVRVVALAIFVLVAAGFRAQADDPTKYTSEVTNPYRQYIPGTTYIYEAETDEGHIREEMKVLDETRTIAGVEARVVWVREWLDDEIYEETYDFYAQDEQGNVYYLGEDTSKVAGGNVVSKEGSWEVGEDTQRFGIVMPADPQVGQEHQQETAAGKAEDMGTIVGVGESVSVGDTTYEDCVKMRDWSSLEPDLDEFKYFCKKVGNAVLIIDNTEGHRIELVEVIRPRN